MTYNIPSHHRGDTWDGINSITINVNGSPINLTNASIKMEFRQAVDSPSVLIFSTTNNTIQVVNPLTGTFRIPARKIEIPFGEYLYDLQVTYADGTVKTYMSGVWNITPDITE
jgi:hypothetical protein